MLGVPGVVFIELGLGGTQWMKIGVDLNLLQGAGVLQAGIYSKNR